MKFTPAKLLQFHYYKPFNIIFRNKCKIITKDNTNVIMQRYVSGASLKQQYHEEYKCYLLREGGFSVFMDI